MNTKILTISKNLVMLRCMHAFYLIETCFLHINKYVCNGGAVDKICKCIRAPERWTLTESYVKLQGWILHRPLKRTALAKLSFPTKLYLSEMIHKYRVSISLPSQNSFKIWISNLDIAKKTVFPHQENNQYDSRKEKNPQKNLEY